MAGYLWTFTVSPDTITTVYVNNTQINGSSMTPFDPMTFTTTDFVEGDTVTISATGYNPKSVIVGETSITLTPMSQEEVSKLSNGVNTYNLRDDVARESISNLATVATSGSYNDLSNKPSIPTVNNSTITFTQGGTTKGTITLNQSGNETIALDAGGSVASIPYGESTSAADATQKEVTISSITSLVAGQIIIVKPTITSTVANSTLKLNNFAAYPMRYGSSGITTSSDSIVWGANYVSWFRFDGDYWVFLGHGRDTDTTYSAMTTANGIAGTETTSRLMRADRLKSIIQGTTLTGLSTSTSSAVVDTDSITVAIGKLQAQIGDVESAINTIRGV